MNFKSKLILLTLGITGLLQAQFLKIYEYDLPSPSYNNNGNNCFVLPATIQDNTNTIKLEPQKPFPPLIQYSVNQIGFGSANHKIDPMSFYYHESMAIWMPNAIERYMNEELIPNATDTNTIDFDELQEMITKMRNPEFQKLGYFRPFDVVDAESNSYKIFNIAYFSDDHTQAKGFVIKMDLKTCDKVIKLLR
jgi:hypothetical protein